MIEMNIPNSKDIKKSKIELRFQGHIMYKGQIINLFKDKKEFLKDIGVGRNDRKDRLLKNG